MHRGTRGSFDDFLLLPSEDTIKRTYAATGMSECPRHRQPRKMYQGELAYSIRLAKQRNVEKLDLLLFQFAKAGKSSRLILSKEPGNVLLRVSYKWAIGYDWVSLGLSRI
jgi:hypothetical protein